MTSCSHELIISNNEPKVSDIANVNLSLSIQHVNGTRTHLAGKTGDTYPVYWSNGDVISVNGVNSSPLSIPEGSNVSDAVFQVRNVSSPFRVLYPASSFGGFDADGIVNLTIPESQEYDPDSFACGSAILFGQSDSPEDVRLNNLCGAICVSLVGEAEVIKNVVLTSVGDKSIAGNFKLDISSGEIKETDGKKEIILSLPQEGVALSSSGTKFFFAIPAGQYPDGFKIGFLDSKKHVQKNFWLRNSKGGPSGVAVSAGELIVFDAVAYAPDAREILSAQDWEEFVLAYNNGSWESDWKGKDGTVKIGSDFSATSLSELDEFSGILDGCGHSISLDAGANPLVNVLSGTIKNLSVCGSSSASAIFCNTICSGGLLDKCTNKAAISLKDIGQNTYAAPFASTMTGGEISDCCNYGQIQIACSLDRSYQLAMGGIAAIVPSLTDVSSITNCRNEGSITLSVTKPSGVGATYPSICGVGGIIGAVIAGTSDKYLSVVGCTNSSSISAEYNNLDNNVAASSSGVGGIVGMAATFDKDFKTFSTASKPLDCIFMKISACRSMGNISNACCSSVSSFLPSKAFAGGIAGVLAGQSSNHINVSDCEFSGEIVGHTGTYGRSALSTVTGGLSGYGGYVDFSKCMVSSSKVGSLKRQAYSCAGAIGLAMSSFKMNECKIFATISFIRNYVSSDENKQKGNYAIGFALSTKTEACAGMRKACIDLEGSEIKNCGFGGSIIYSTDIIAYNSATPSAVETCVISESNFSDFIASESFSVDGETAKKITCSNNYYWDGN